MDHLMNSRNLQISGLMGNGYLHRRSTAKYVVSFRKLKSAVLMKFKLQLLASNFNFTEISMGMSSDYQLAIEEGQHHDSCGK